MQHFCENGNSRVKCVRTNTKYLESHRFGILEKENLSLQKKKKFGGKKINLAKKFFAILHSN
jgi:hypothetical protein